MNRSVYRRSLLNPARLLEGIGIAFDSVRSNKVRASLTILGVAIGVSVVIAIGAGIRGINNSIVDILNETGPKTFFVYRYFSGGLNFSDGSDELSPWRKNPWISVKEAELIRKQPGIKAVTVSEGTQGPVSYGDVNLGSVSIAGFNSTWIDVNGGDLVEGRNFSDAGMAEICDLHGRLIANLRLGLSVFLNGDLKSAQELLAQKVLFRDLERAYADSHLARLAENTQDSIETSSLHLDLIADLKRINSHISSMAYPILEQAGVLMKTRLKDPDVVPARAA